MADGEISGERVRVADTPKRPSKARARHGASTPPKELGHPLQNPGRASSRSDGDGDGDGNSDSDPFSLVRSDDSEEVDDEEDADVVINLRRPTSSRRTRQDALAHHRNRNANANTSPERRAILAVVGEAEGLGLCDQVASNLMECIAQELRDEDAYAAFLRDGRPARSNIPPPLLSHVLGVLWRRPDTVNSLGDETISTQIVPSYVRAFGQLYGVDVGAQLVRSCRQSSTNPILNKVCLLAQSLLDRREVGWQEQRDLCIGLHVDDSRRESVFTTACCGRLTVQRLRSEDLAEVRRLWKDTSGRIGNVRIRTPHGYRIMQRNKDHAPMIAKMQQLICGLCQRWKYPPARTVVELGTNGNSDSYNVCCECGDCIACALDVLSLVRAIGEFRGLGDYEQDDKLHVLCTRFLLHFEAVKFRLTSQRASHMDLASMFMYPDPVLVNCNDTDLPRTPSPVHERHSPPTSPQRGARRSLHRANPCFRAPPSSSQKRRIAALLVDDDSDEDDNNNKGNPSAQGASRSPSPPPKRQRAAASHEDLAELVRSLQQRVEACEEENSRLRERMSRLEAKDHA